MNKTLLVVLTTLLPLYAAANTLNNGNNPPQPGYNPSTQRLQQKMQIQQSQQKLKLQQDQQREQQNLQRKMQEQRNAASQRTLNNQPGHRNNTLPSQ